MWSIEIFFRDGSYERIDGLKSISYNTSGTKQTATDFLDYRFHSGTSYSIASDSTNIAVSGSDIHYAKFTKA